MGHANGRAIGISPCFKPLQHEAQRTDCLQVRTHVHSHACTHAGARATRASTRRASAKCAVFINHFLYIGMARYCHGLYSYGLYSYGTESVRNVRRSSTTSSDRHRHALLEATRSTALGTRMPSSPAIMVQAVLPSVVISFWLSFW